MGVYDEYGERHVQLKVGERSMKHFVIGDPVSIPDGVYIGWEGVVVISDGILIAEFSELTKKWGGRLGVGDALRGERRGF